jgi:hypothetical protein
VGDVGIIPAIKGLLADNTQHDLAGNQQGLEKTRLLFSLSRLDTGDWSSQGGYYLKSLDKIRNSDGM